MGVINHKRGPKFKEDDEKKKYRLVARVTGETYVDVIRILEADNVSMSDYIRTIIEEDIQARKDRERYGYDEY